MLKLISLNEAKDRLEYNSASNRWITTQGTNFVSREALIRFKPQAFHKLKTRHNKAGFNKVYIVKAN